MKISDPSQNRFLEHVATYKNVEVVPFSDRVAVIGVSDNHAGTLALTWEQVIELSSLLDTLLQKRETGQLSLVVSPLKDANETR